MSLEATKRQPIGYAQRFRILERDKFRCQYCGARAGDVELEVDHLWPVSKGGTSDNWNLITACHACNQGKKARGAIRFAARFAMFQGFYQSAAKDPCTDRQLDIAAERLFWKFFGDINDWINDDRLRAMLGEADFNSIVELEHRCLRGSLKGRVQ